MPFFGPRTRHQNSLIFKVGLCHHLNVNLNLKSLLPAPGYQALSKSKMGGRDMEVVPEVTRHNVDDDDCCGDPDDCDGDPDA